MPRNSRLSAHQCLVLLCGGASVAVGGLCWVGPSFCLSARVADICHPRTFVSCAAGLLLGSLWVWATLSTAIGLRERWAQQYTGNRNGTGSSKEEGVFGANSHRHLPR